MNYIHGAVLKITREDTLSDVERMFIQMKECGLNTAVIWPAAFWWEEKKEGYPFNTGKEILKIAERVGIKIIMELAGQLSIMEYIPDFLMKEEYYPIDANGIRICNQSSFGYLNYFHPEVQALMREHYRKTAQAYRNAPALFAYDVFNETMFRSYDGYSMADFRLWLKEKYGHIENLNRVWERTYSKFDEVSYTSWKWMSIMPEADFSMWQKAAVSRFLKPLCDEIKSIDPIHPLIADNIHSQVAPSAIYGRPHGDYSLKEAVDEIGMSFYPKQQSSEFSHTERWEIFDGFASAASGEGFYISEMQTHAQALYNTNTCVKTQELKQWCMEAYAAGAKGIVYWMWRPFNKGLQTMGRGLVNYRNVPTERYHTVKELSKIFERYSVIKPTKSKVGVVYHELSDDLSRGFTARYSVDTNFYNKSVYGAYKVFCDINAKADIITLNDLSKYECAVISNAVALSESDVEKIKKFVKSGGKVIFDGKFGVVNEEGVAYGKIPANELSSLIGEVFFDTDNECADFKAGTKKTEAFWGRNIYETTGASVLGRFADGNAAFVKRAYGKGEFYAFNLHLFYSYLENGYASIRDLISELCDNFSLQTFKTSSGVRLRLCENEDKYLVFAFNYTEKSVSEEIEVEIGGKKITRLLSILANGVEILEIDK